MGLESQKRAANAIRNGHFDNSLVSVRREDGSLALDREEYPRPQTTLEGLAALKPAFTAVADYPLDDQGTTYRNLILQKYPDLNIDFMHQPAIRPASSMDQRPSCWRHRPMRGRMA